MSVMKNPLPQRSVRLLLTSLLALVALQQPALATELPRLVVYITIEDLRGDYLEELRPYLASQGLQRMMSEGKLYRQVTFPLAEINRASATATLHTASYPYVHGLERPSLWVPSQSRWESVFTDPSVLGNYTRDTYSPKNLLVHTLGDRLREASAGSSIVYSIASDAEVAIASGGWFANGAFWLDSKIGSWATSTHYEEMPKFLEAYNRSNEGPNKRLVSGQVVWSPLQTYTPKSGRQWSDWGKGFSYRYQGHQVADFKRSALANEEVTALALRLIDQGGYAESRSTGMLSLSYSLDVAPRDALTSELTVEELDAYVRLDRNVQAILSELDKKFGQGNYLVALAGTGYTHYRRPRIKGAEARYGRFSTKKGAALLNLYLSAIHGQGSWVERLADGRIYLNKKLIESKKMSLSDLQEQSAAFIEEMQGIGYAVAGHHLIAQSSLSDLGIALRRSVHNKYLADVYWSLIPGWEVEETADNPHLWLHSTAIASPCILFGAGIDPKTFTYPILTAPDVAKAISYVLRIRPPNAAQ